MTALHDTGELTCPRCGVTFEDMSDDRARDPMREGGER